MLLSHVFRISLLGAALAAGSAQAASYQYRLYLPGFVSPPMSQPPANDPPAAQALVLALSAATLPMATQSQPYTYDLAGLLTVTGDSAYQASLVGWSQTELPAGLTLSALGLISGTPTAANEAGSSIQVTALYKDQSGQQTYTIVVNGVALQVVQVSAGDHHACAVTPAGGVKCWGYNVNGQLGDGTNTDRWTPVDVQGLTSGVAKVAAGSYHTCAVLTTGGVRCWGHNTFGQLGDLSVTR